MRIGLQFLKCIFSLPRDPSKGMPKKLRWKKNVDSLFNRKKWLLKGTSNNRDFYPGQAVDSTLRQSRQPTFPIEQIWRPLGRILDLRFTPFSWSLFWGPKGGRRFTKVWLYLTYVTRAWNLIENHCLMGILSSW